MDKTDKELNFYKKAELLAEVGWWSIELPSNQLVWSPQIYRIHGVSPEEYSPAIDTAIDFYHPDDRKRVLSYVEQSIEEGKGFEFSLRIVRKNGDIRYVRSKAVVEFGEQHEVKGITGIFHDVTDEMQKDHAFNRHQVAYQTLINSSHDGYWDWRIQDDYEYMSPRFWEMFGYLPEEKDHKPSAWQDMIFEEDLALAMSNFQKHVASKGAYPYRQEVRYHHKNGSTITVLCRGQVIEWDDQHQPLRMVGTHTDITQLKQDTTEVKQTLQFQRLLMNANTDLVFVKNEQLEIVEANHAFLKIYPNKTREQIIGSTTVEDYDPKEAELFFEQDRKALAEGESEVVETIQFPDGKERTLLTRKMRFIDYSGEKYLLCVARDITALHLIQQKLSQSEETFRAIYEHSPDAYFIMELENAKIIDCNEAAEEMLCGNKERILGNTAGELSPELQADGRNSKAQVEEYIKVPTSKGRHRFNWLHKRLTEEVFPCDVNISVINYENRKALLVGWRDMTERQEAEDTIKETAESLKIANEELQEFAYRTSHDLRSPLISSRRLLQVILKKIKDGDNEKAMSYFQIVDESLEKLEALVNDILEMTKMKYDEALHEPTDIPVVIEEILRSISHMEGFSRITFEYENSIPGMVTTSIVLVSHVLENFISNAIKYQNLNEATPRVLITTKLVDEHLVLSISDNGIGIPEKYQDSVFSMFKRFHPKTAFGSGLGLYMVKKSVSRLGGSVSYEPLEQGSKFTVKLKV